jgi:hypothetical protein
MQKIYKIINGGGGKCSCGHNQHIGKCYYLLETGVRTYTMCQQCGKEQGLDRWWGDKQEITVEEMRAHWFGAEPIKEVVCRQLNQYTRKSEPSQKREEMLKNAVSV